MLGTDEDSVVEAREHALVSVADEMGLEGEDRLDQVRAMLAELPAGEWSGVAAPVEDENEDEEDPGEELDAMATAGPDSALYEEAEYELETDRVLEEADALAHERLEPPPEYVPREELAKDDTEDERAPEPVAAVDPTPAAVMQDEPAREAAAPPAPKPAAEKKRRSRTPVLLALLTLLIAVAVLLAVLASGDDDSNPAASDPGSQSAPAPSGGSGGGSGSTAELTPVGGAARGASGTARLTGGGDRLEVSVKGLPAAGEGAYNAWLYNSVIDARRLGGGNRGIALDIETPADLDRFRFIDISFEPSDGNTNHSGRSVVRVPTAELEK